jgi:VanZ family protein
MGLLFYLSSRPVPEELKWLPIIAKLKIVHIIEYGILYLFVWYAVIKTTACNKLETFALVLMITVLYGLTDEFHQIFVQARTARLEDVVADGVGGVMAQAGISILRKYRH